MTTWQVEVGFLSVTVEVEAETEEEAMKKAEDEVNGNGKYSPEIDFSCTEILDSWD